MNMMNMQMPNFMNMKTNVGSNERYVRLGLGLAAAAAFPFIRSIWGRSVLGLAATSGISTGLARYCPLNEAFGRGMAPEAESEASSVRSFTSGKVMRGSQRMSESSTESPSLPH